MRESVKESIIKYIKNNMPDYKILDIYYKEYKNNKNRKKHIFVKMICNNNHEIDMAWHSIKKGHRCKYCAGNERKTNEQFKQEVYDLVGDEYVFLEEYKGTDTKILVQHKCEKCGNYTYKVTPDSFINRGSRCPACMGRIRNKTDSYFKEEVYRLVGNEYTVVSKYKGANKKVRMRHNNDRCNNYEWELKATHFINSNSRCPKCSIEIAKEKTRKTQEQFMQEVYNLVGDEYTVLGEYINSNTKILFRHNSEKCNYNEFEMQPSCFTSAEHRCPKCQHRSYKKTTEEFKKEVYDLVGNEYTVLGEYITSQEKIDIKHNVCNTIWGIRPPSFLSGIRCPVCNESKGEQKVRLFLKENNLSYDREYDKFNDLRGLGGRLLRFDFVTFFDQKKEKLNYLIEYDGIQHFEWQKGLMTEEDFEKLQKHDKMKNEYCKKRNIKLIRIPYWEFDNIEIILNDILIKDNVSSEFII